MGVCSLAERRAISEREEKEVRREPMPWGAIQGLFVGPD